VGRGRVIDVEPSRSQLRTAGTELVAVDLLTMVATRAAHVIPGRLALCAAVAKAAANTLANRQIRRLQEVAAARGVLADDLGGVLDKVVRDNAVVRVIDTSVIGNLKGIALALPTYGSSVEAPLEDEQALADICDLSRPLPPLRYPALTLRARADDPVVTGAPATVAALRRRLADTNDAAGQQILIRAEEIRDRLRDLIMTALEVSRTSAAGRDAQWRLSTNFSYLYLAAAALHVFRFNPTSSLFGEPPGSSVWLLPVLQLCLDAVALPPGPEIELAGGLTSDSPAANLIEESRLISLLGPFVNDGHAGPSPSPRISARNTI
jgi:hypothetical protein